MVESQQSIFSRIYTVGATLSTRYDYMKYLDSASIL